MDGDAIIERIPSFDDRMMYDWCLRLSRVMSKTKEFKKGSGKSSKIVVTWSLTRVITVYNTTEEIWRNQK